MSDVEKFMELFQSVDVIPTLNKRGDVIELYIGTGDSSNVVGFSMFYVSMLFDLDGKFLTLGIWE
jgi:hypothetical protein